MGILNSKPIFFRVLNHMAILAEPLLSSDFGLSLDRLLKTGLTVYRHMYQNEYLLQKNFSIQEWPLYKGL